MSVSLYKVNSPEDSNPYKVQPDAGRYRVVNDEGSTVIICADAANADQYAVLLNQAFHRGYKAGLRKGRGQRD